MLIDSGADIILIPRISIESIGVNIHPNAEYELMGFDGNISVAQVVTLDLIFLRRTFRGKFLLTDQQVGILGRDVINHISLILDGQNMFEVQSPAFRLPDSTKAG